jgi:hypothetical protein
VLRGGTWSAAASLALVLGACAGDREPVGPDGGADEGGGKADDPDGRAPDAAPEESCVALAAGAEVAVGMAAADGEHALFLPAAAASATSWGEEGNEALVLDVATARRGVIGQLVLHHGPAPFEYGMALGALAAGEEVRVAISPLSAERAAPEACVGPARLVAASELGAEAEGLLNAPIMVWPAGKRFDDLPVLVGWSAARRGYQMVYTAEDGGTVASCGGGADGVEAELARWGRAADIETLYSYGDAARWGRCTGSTPVATVSPRFEGSHPILYYGDGHNRLFESRGGYGQVCGSGSAEKADGDLAGWNVGNPGNGPERDAEFAVTLRPLPVALDPLGYGRFGGRREALLDAYAPWIYRMTFLELEREGRIDGAHALPLDRYLYADVHASGVNGAGDRVCSFTVSGGFVFRVVTTSGAVLSGPQMTQDFFTGSGENWKRLAIPLPAGFTAADVDHFVFDAYDDDGIYLMGLGDVFLTRADGAADATLEVVRSGTAPLAQFVDDDRTDCQGGVNTGGPGGVAYECVGGLVAIPR